MKKRISTPLTETLSSTFTANIWLLPQILQLTQSPEEKNAIKHFEGEKTQPTEWYIKSIKNYQHFSYLFVNGHQQPLNKWLKIVTSEDLTHIFSFHDS